jgi:flagellar basal-body rod protein FlgB
MSSMIDNRNMQAARLALNGLGLRQQVISRNIANVDTPGYQAQDVNFEQAVQQALKKVEQPSLSVTNVAHIQPGQSTTSFIKADRPGGSERADGNDVDIDNELMQMNETGVRYQALTQLVNLKFQLIKNLTASR